METTLAVWHQELCAGPAVAAVDISEDKMKQIRWLSTIVRTIKGHQIQIYDDTQDWYVHASDNSELIPIEHDAYLHLDRVMLNITEKSFFGLGTSNIPTVIRDRSYFH